MKRTLFLDDCPTRTEWARKNLCDLGNSLACTDTAEGAIRLLAATINLPSSAFNLVHLDHDLDGKAWANPNGKNTGSEVVRWILSSKPTIGRVVVHSMNTPAGNRMAKALRRAGYNAEYRSWLTIVNETTTTSSPATGPR